MWSLLVRPARPSMASLGGRQMNSEDTQTAGSVVSRSQAARRHPTVSQSDASPAEPNDGVRPEVRTSSVNAEEESTLVARMSVDDAYLPHGPSIDRHVEGVDDQLCTVSMGQSTIRRRQVSITAQQ